MRSTSEHTYFEINKIESMLEKMWKIFLSVQSFFNINDESRNVSLNIVPQNSSAALN